MNKADIINYIYTYSNRERDTQSLEKKNYIKISIGKKCQIMDEKQEQIWDKHCCKSVMTPKKGNKKNKIRISVFDIYT